MYVYIYLLTGCVCILILCWYYISIRMYVYIYLLTGCVYILILCWYYISIKSYYFSFKKLIGLKTIIIPIKEFCLPISIITRWKMVKYANHFIVESNIWHSFPPLNCDPCMWHLLFSYPLFPRNIWKW